MRILFLAFIVLSVAQGADAPAELHDLVAKYTAARERVEMPLSELDEWYLKELDALRSKAQGAGDLSGVLAVEREVASHPYRPSRIPSDQVSLVKLSSDYETRRETIEGNLRPALDRLEKVYFEQLEALQTDLTKEGRFEEALQVKDFAGLVKRGGEPVGDDLLAHWKFDGNAQDSGISRFHGRDYGTNYVEGRIGSGSASFGEGRYALVGNRAELNLLHPFTLSVWIHPTHGKRQPAAAPILVKGSESWRLQWGALDQSIEFLLKEKPEGLAVKSPPSSIDDGKWHHVAVVFTGKDLFLYLDGKRVAEDGKHTYEITHESETDLGIGLNPDSKEEAFEGVIDDIRLYRGVLGPMEVRALAEMEK